MALEQYGNFLVFVKGFLQFLTHESYLYGTVHKSVEYHKKQSLSLPLLAEFKTLFLFLESKPVTSCCFQTCC